MFFFKIQILFNDSFLDIFFTICSIISYFIKSKKRGAPGGLTAICFTFVFTSYPIDLRYCKNCVNVLDDAIARSRSSSISVLRVGFSVFCLPFRIVHSLFRICDYIESILFTKCIRQPSHSVIIGMFV